MGARGPIPSREDDLARPRSRKGSDQQEVTRGELRKVTVPKADPDWHPISKMLWESLKKSGQSDFYQQSDWAFAYSLCEDLSLYKKPSVDRNGEEYFKRSGQMLQTIYSAMERLLVTEGDRRRVRIELHEPDSGEDLATVTAIEGAKKALGLV